MKREEAAQVHADIEADVALARGRKIVTVLPQPDERATIRRAERVLGDRGRVRGLNRIVGQPSVQGAKETADIAAAGDGGQVIDFAERVVFGRSLKDAEVEGGAADAAAGEGEADGLGLTVTRGDARDLPALGQSLGFHLP